MTEALKMNPHGFETMSNDKLMAVDGGIAPIIAYAVVAAVVMLSTSSCSGTGKTFSKSFAPFM